MDCEIIDEFFSMLLFSLKIHWSILHFEWIFYPCIDHLESISSLNYVDLPNVHIFDIQFQKKITLVNTTIHPIRKVFRYWDTMKFTEANTSFPKFIFLHEGSNSITVCCFPFNDSFTPLLFEKMSTEYPNLNNHSSSEKYCSMKNATRSVHNPIAQELFLTTTI